MSRAKGQFGRVLVANRGEIAVRVIRTLRELDVTSIAIFSEPDREALHVLLADEAYPVGPGPSRESYLDLDKVLDTAARVKADAIRAMLAIGGAGMARVDFFLDAADGSLWLNEINTLPGFTDVSMYPRLWGLSGVPLDKLCDRLVRTGIERHERKRRLDEGVRQFVDSLRPKG